MEKAFGLYDPSMDKDSCGVGFIAEKYGEKSHSLVLSGLQILKNLEHRGARGEDALAGDGAGIMTQLPHDFFVLQCAQLGFSLPEFEEYAVGTVFLPQQQDLADQVKQMIGSVVAEEEMTLLGWRLVPTDREVLSKNMLAMEPRIEQFFLLRQASSLEDFERDLYVLRRMIEKRAESLDPAIQKFFYLPLISSSRIVYKGMLMASQLDGYFPDLGDEHFKSAIAVVHQRYSTNTFPSWGLAHPFRLVAHNGEINTLRSNINWSISRNDDLSSSLFGKNLKKVQPILDITGSDSACFDNMLELLVHAGRSLEHAMHIMMPPAWENDPTMDAATKSFFAYNSTLLEPWDGPAAMVFSDGQKVGAMLDRNGLRPLRYTETTDGFFILASETGVLDLPIEKIKTKGKVGPGEMILVDTINGAILYDSEIKKYLVASFPFEQWVEENTYNLKDFKAPAVRSFPNHEEILFRQQVFSYTTEQCQLLLKPMAEKADETTYAMGTDTPLAVLSKLPKSIYSYFKQKFAQVTNPAIDSIREEVVMSLRTIVGGGYNLLEDDPKNCRVLEIEQPILTNSELEQLRNLNIHSFRSTEVSICYPMQEISLERALDDLCRLVEERVDEGYRLVVLSDRNFSRSSAPIPALLATAAVHHHLIRVSKRGRVGLIIETGDALEVHHFACLIGYGAGAINPYLALESITDMEISGMLVGVDQSTAQLHYIKAIQKGLKKIFAKMGVSTFLSYQGGQNFEILGLHGSIVQKYFTGTHSFLDGVGLEGLESDLKKRHNLAYRLRERGHYNLLTGGEYNWRMQGEFHAYNPETIHFLQQAAWHNDPAFYAKFKARVDDTLDHPWTVRSLLQFQSHRPAVPIEEVEPLESILKRFSGGAMSIGAISKEAHEVLAIAFNRMGGKSNTGEGGEDEARYQLDSNGDNRRSAIKQVASGRFGVTSHYLVNADELQIKVAQGAKPGEGGQLPGFKVDAYIAKLRHTIPGVTLISPPPHHDIYSIEDLSQLIFDLKNVNPEADVSVKLVASSGIGAVAAGVAKAKADSITIAGYEGGTGASPATSIKHAGIPWELGLIESQQALLANNLRSKVRLQVDGHIKTGRDVVIGALLGADEFGFATSVLVTTGCIMMRKCHLNTCPVGIATQSKDLRKKFHGKPEHVIHYLHFVAQDVRQIMAELGFRKFEEMIGQVDFLAPNQAFFEKYAKLGLNLDPLLKKVVPKDGFYSKQAKQSSDLEGILDKKLISLAEKALQSRQAVQHQLTIKNSDRSVGAMLGGEISKRYGSAGLAEGTIQFEFTGTAGQSFGAFLPRGVLLKVIGDANDYVGKGLSGGKLIVVPPKNALFQANETTIAGNTCLYGATSGKVFIAGRVGQRFAVRNSGAEAVVEGVGDHGCEYMTGGRVVVLGPTGKNFGAGMSGGLAYVYDPFKNLKKNCNKAMVEVEQLVSSEQQDELYQLIKEYFEATESKVAKVLVANYSKRTKDFVVVVPFEYRRILAKQYYVQKAV